MRFIFASTTCSEKAYEAVFNSRTKKLIDPMQKFLLQIMRGLSVGSDNIVESISVKPVSHSCYNAKKIEYSSEQEGNISFEYVSFRNGRITRFISTYIAVYNKTKELLKNVANTVIVTDPLNPYISMPARLAAKKMGVKSVAIITDLPLFASTMKQRKANTIKSVLRDIYERFSNNEAKKYDAYIFLTDSMNAVVNVKKRPFIVVEGTAVPPKHQTSKSGNKSKRVFVYAGGVYEKYGVKCLVDAFCEAGLQNTELHIYGEGTYVGELKGVCDKNASVRYCGCVLNTELQEIESNADLLINPRFSDEEYTQFSFPSKTLEYLSSGTAVLSTRLKGIPLDYEPFLLWFSDESVKGMKEKLIEISALSDCELQEKGRLGQEFVLEKKNNIAQGKKITSFVESVLK